MNIFLCLALFLSGISALIFEILWFRLAGLLFGNSIWAASIVLSSFMGGLALGNSLMASRGDQLKRPIRYYAGLELVIAFSGVLLVFLFPHLTKILRPLFTPLLDQPVILNAIRTLFAFVLLLIPTTAMGATLPVVVKAVNKRINNFGNVLGFLYGSNTLGAVLGVLGAEIFLIKQYGLMGTGIMAMSLNILAAVIAFGISMKINEQPSDAAPYQSPRTASLSPRSKGLLAAGFFSGLAFLALEVLWFRFMILFFNAFTLNLAIMLSIILAAISLGGFLASLWFNKRDSAQPLLLGLLIFSASVVVLGYAQFYHFLRSFYFDPQVPEIRRIIYSSFFLIFPLSLSSGMIFTTLGKMLHHELNVDARTTGYLTLANTLGGMCGSFLAGFLFIPFLGMEISFLLIALIYGSIIFFIINGQQALAGKDKRTMLATAALLLVIFAAFPFGSMIRYLDLTTVKFHNNFGENRVAVKEGTNETIQYLQKRFLDQPQYYRLMTNGHSMSTTMLSGKRYMKTFVYLPVAIHPHPKKAALICFGCGMTAKALTDTKAIETIDMVDISKDVIEMSRTIFPEPSSNPVNDKRVRLHIEDGRFFLLTTTEKFDIITGEPPPPKYRGIVNLYTQEHFQLIHDRLADGGIASYWLPVYMLTLQNTKSVIKAFCNAFPHCSLWNASGYNWMLVGIKDPAFGASPMNFTAQWRDPLVSHELHALGLQRPEHLGAFFVADSKRLGEWTKGSLPLTDDFPGRLYDEFDETAMKNDLIHYQEFLDDRAIAKNFEESEDIARIWPHDLVKETSPYFPYAQGMIFDKPTTSLEFVQTLQKYLNNPLSTDFDIYWLLDSDEYAQRILTDMLEEFQQTPQTMFNILQGNIASMLQNNQRQKIPEVLEACKHLAVRAIIDKDFALAERYYGLIGELSDGANKMDYNYLRLFLLFRSTGIERASEMIQHLRDTATATELNDYNNLWQWLNTTFKQ